MKAPMWPEIISCFCFVMVIKGICSFKWAVMLETGKNNHKSQSCDCGTLASHKADLPNIQLHDCGVCVTINDGRGALQAIKYPFRGHHNFKEWLLIYPLLKQPLLDSTCPNSHIPFLEKVVEKVLAWQLQRVLDEVDYLNPFQSVFSILAWLWDRNSICRTCGWSLARAGLE